MDTSKQVTVVGISGSLRNGSYTTLATAEALRGAEQEGALTHLINLSEYDLKFCNGGDDEPTGDVLKLQNLVGAAQGIILGTPEYHGSYSGVLKNALDLMGFKEFEGKMVGLLGVSGGMMGGLNAMNELRSVGRTLHAWVIPGQVAIPNASAVFDKSGNVIDKKMNVSLIKLGQQVASFSKLHLVSRDTAFLKAWEEAPLNPGGD